jgi:hypothetical protein
LDSHQSREKSRYEELHEEVKQGELLVARDFMKGHFLLSKSLCLHMKRNMITKYYLKYIS